MATRVINNFSKPITLDNGIILAASGTDGSVRENVELTDRDRKRHVETGRIAVIEDVPKPRTTRPTTTEEVKN